MIIEFMNYFSYLSKKNKQEVFKNGLSIFKKEIILNGEKGFNILWSNFFMTYEASKIFSKINDSFLSEFAK